MTPEAAEAAVRDSLADQGSGVLTEIDVAATELTTPFWPATATPGAG